MVRWSNPISLQALIHQPAPLAAPPAPAAPRGGEAPASPRSPNGTIVSIETLSSFNGDLDNHGNQTTKEKRPKSAHICARVK